MTTKEMKAAIKDLETVLDDKKSQVKLSKKPNKAEMEKVITTYVERVDEEELEELKEPTIKLLRGLDLLDDEEDEEDDEKEEDEDDKEVEEEEEDGTENEEEEEEEEEEDDDDIGKEEKVEIKSSGSRLEDKKGGKKKGKEEKTKEKKGGKGPSEKSRYGHRLDSMAGMIDEMLWKGTTVNKAIETLAKAFPEKTEAALQNKFKSHCRYLGPNKNVTVKFNEKTGVYKTTEASSPLYVKE